MQQKNCPHYIKGTCHKGRKCPLLHSFAEKQNKKTFVKKRSFTDLTKLEETSLIFQQNQTLYDGPQNTLLSCAKLAATPREKEILQYFRRFQNSIRLLPPPESTLLTYIRTPNPFLAEIKFVPSISRKVLPFNEQVQEGYFILAVHITPQYPAHPARFEITNPSLPEDFRELLTQLIQEIHEDILDHSLVNTVKHLDNYFDKICEELERRRPQLILY